MQGGVCNSVRFWKDPWGDSLASDLFRRAFSYALNEDISVGHFLSANTRATNFALPLSPQALQEIRLMQVASSHIVLNNASHDQWTYIWGAEKYASNQ